METNSNVVVNILSAFDGITNKPETFVSGQTNFTNNVRNLLKQTYDFTKKEETKSFKSDALPELIIQDFDLEQIWQQLELQNDELLNKSIADVSKLAVAKSRLAFDNIGNEQVSDDDDDNNNSVSDKESLPPTNENDNSEQDDNIEEPELQEEEEVDDDDNLSEESDGADDNNSNSPKVRKKFKSAVDDEFFKLDEMNKFLLSEEQKGSKVKKDESSDSESEGSVNMFEEGSEKDEDENNDFEGNDKVNNPRYKDFFGTKEQQYREWEDRMMQSLEEKEPIDDEDNDEVENADKNDNDPKSTLELREERLKMKIKEIEEIAVSEKPWQLKGEVTAENRPQNSLLQEVLEFDLTTRPAPVITEETTYILEDVIRRRIKDKAYDDVVRKEKPVDTPLEFKKKLLLNQEKSKESLAQIYEKEYVQQREALNPDAAEKEEEEPKLHKEVKTMMHSLFAKLDALSNFHFTPRPAAPELKVVSNLPAISMEEVAPVSASDAALLAPEEIKRKNKGDIQGKNERTATDKRRERRQKKRKQKRHAAAKLKKEKLIEKLNPGLGNKYSKEKTRKMLDKVTKDANVDKMNESLSGKSLKSSTAFFTQLQEEVRSQIKTKNNPKKKIQKTIDARKMKL